MPRLPSCCALSCCIHLCLLPLAPACPSACQLLWFSGRVRTPLLVEQDAAVRTMTFRLVPAGCQATGDRSSSSGARGSDGGVGNGDVDESDVGVAARAEGPCAHLAAMEGSWTVTSGRPGGARLLVGTASANPRGSHVDSNLAKQHLCRRQGVWRVGHAEVLLLLSPAFWQGPACRQQAQSGPQGAAAGRRNNSVLAGPCPLQRDPAPAYSVLDRRCIHAGCHRCLPQRSGATWRGRWACGCAASGDGMGVGPPAGLQGLLAAGPTIKGVREHPLLPLQPLCCSWSSA